MQAVVRRSADPDSGFAEFVDPYWADMCRLARRLAPPGQWEDVLQDALTTAWRKREQFDPSRGSERNWLLAVVADKCRKSRRGLRVIEKLDDPEVDARDSVADLDLRRAIAELTVRQRTVVVLFYYLGLPLDDIAAVLSRSEGTVKSTLSDARARLRVTLGEDYPHA